MTRRVEIGELRNTARAMAKDNEVMGWRIEELKKQLAVEQESNRQLREHLQVTWSTLKKTVYLAQMYEKGKK